MSPELSTLLVRLCGVFQSWSTSERTRVYDSGTEPSKSGVIGLLMAAMGLSMTSDTSRFRAMRFGVRADREGRPFCDNRIATNVPLADCSGTSTVMTERWFLADADFLVGFESHDVEFLKEIHAALASPKNLLFLGRRTCTPTLPAWVKDGVRHGVALEAALVSQPWCPRRRDVNKTELRLVIETKDGSGDLRRDDPVSLNPAKPFYGWRGTRSSSVKTNELIVNESWTGLPIHVEKEAS